MEGGKDGSLQVDFTLCEKYFKFTHVSSGANGEVFSNEVGHSVSLSQKCSYMVVELKSKISLGANLENHLLYRTHRYSGMQKIAWLIILNESSYVELEGYGYSLQNSHLKDI